MLPDTHFKSWSMKRLILILLTLFSLTSYSQKIEENKFDKFDSIYQISTKDEILVGKVLAKKYLYVNTSFNWFTRAEFINLSAAKSYKILIGFKTDIQTSTDNDTKIKVEFADGTFGEYSRPTAKYEIVTDMGFFIFDVPLGDKLFTTDIKTIRISTSDTNIDYEIPAKKASYIKNALTLTKSESEKLK